MINYNTITNKSNYNNKSLNIINNNHLLNREELKYDTINSNISKNNLFNIKYCNGNDSIKYKTMEQDDVRSNNIKRPSNINKNKNKFLYSNNSNKTCRKNVSNFLNNIEKENTPIDLINKYNTINISERESNYKKNKSLNTANCIDINYNHKNLSKNYEESKNNNEYYYSFRKNKISYNSFNSSSKQNSTKKMIPHELKKPFKKNRIPISLRDNSKFQTFKGIQYKVNINKMNKLYLNNYKRNTPKNKLSFLDLTSKKESTRQQSNDNLNTNNNNTNNNNETFTDKRIKKNNNYEMESNVVNECYYNNINDMNKKNKIEKSMTLQSLSDSKMMELAEHYINNGEDSFETLDFKCLKLQKNMKKAKECRDITFG